MHPAKACERDIKQVSIPHGFPRGVSGSEPDRARRPGARAAVAGAFRRCPGDSPRLPPQLLQVQGIGEDTAEAIASWEKTVDLGAELKRIADFGCRIVTQADAEYPELLRQIYDPPVVLYVKGELLPKDKNAVAMVGSRMTTHYGMETARKLAYQLAYLGVTVVSGGARGIDSAAHQGALSAKGRTIAVLGTGINLVIPPENAEALRAHRRQRRAHHPVPLQPPRRTNNPSPSATASSPA